MIPIPRIVAVCQGGILDGLRFSIALNGKDKPQKFAIHGPEGEVTYFPIQEIAITDSIEEQLYAGFERHDPEDLDHGIVSGHDFKGAWIYKDQDA